MLSPRTTATLASHVAALAVLFATVGGVGGMSQSGELKLPTGKLRLPDSNVSADNGALTSAAVITQFRSLMDSINQPAVSNLREWASNSLAPLAKANRQSERLEEMFSAFRVAVQEAATERGISLTELSSWPHSSDADTNQ